MKPDHIEEALDKAVQKVVWGNQKPAEYVSDYVHKTMLDPEWDALEMLQYELMALKMRNQYGFNLPTEQD
jgi:hypothetical protein